MTLSGPSNRRTKIRGDYQFRSTFVKLGAQKNLIYLAFSIVTVLLIIAGFLFASPNESAYWGVRSSMPPDLAARELFSKADFRFLGISVEGGTHGSYRYVPAIQMCGNHPSGNRKAYDLAQFASIVGVDTKSLVETLHKYANTYNLAMLDLLNNERQAECVAHHL